MFALFSVTFLGFIAKLSLVCKTVEHFHTHAFTAFKTFFKPFAISCVTA